MHIIARVVRGLAALLACWIPAAFAQASSAPLLFLGDRNLPPYEFLDNGVPKGANVDLIHEIGRVLGRPVVIELMDWKVAQARFLEGHGDALTMLARTPERERDYAFTAQTLPVQFALFVRSDEFEMLAGASLGGRRIAVPAGGLTRTVLLQAHPEARPREVASVQEGLRMLLRREIDVLAAQEWSAFYQLGQMGATSVRALPPFHARHGNIAVRASEAKLATQLDAALAQVKADGSFDRIFDRWSSTRVRTVLERDISIAAIVATLAIVVLGLLLGLALQLRRRGLRLAQEIEVRKSVESQVRQAKDELEQADRLKDRFLATLAHELRGPMTPIANAMAILQRSRGDVEREQWVVSVVGRQLDHLGRLVDDLLDIGRINSGAIRLHEEPVPLDGLLAEIVEGFTGELQRAGLRVDLQLQAANAVVLADRTRLQQVFTNLLTNAIRYTPSGGTVTVGLVCEESIAVVHVQDTGMGFDAQVAANVFEMFYRQEQAAQKAPGGLGLGLWLCRRLVEMHGGRIEAHSAGAGQGARFTVSLPLSSAQTAHSSPSP